MDGCLVLDQAYLLETYNFRATFSTQELSKSYTHWPCLNCCGPSGFGLSGITKATLKRKASHLRAVCCLTTETEVV